MKSSITNRDLERLSGQTQVQALTKARYWMGKADSYVDPNRSETALLIAQFWLNVYVCITQTGSKSTDPEETR